MNVMIDRGAYKLAMQLIPKQSENVTKRYGLHTSHCARCLLSLLLLCSALDLTHISHAVLRFLPAHSHYHGNE